MTLDRRAVQLMTDHELHAHVARLERTVSDLSHARGEIGLRIAATYRDALDAAQAELLRRTQNRATT